MVSPCVIKPTPKRIFREERDALGWILRIEVVHQRNIFGWNLYLHLCSDVVSAKSRKCLTYDNARDKKSKK